MPYAAVVTTYAFRLARLSVRLSNSATTGIEKPKPKLGGTFLGQE